MNALLFALGLLIAVPGHLILGTFYTVPLGFTVAMFHTRGTANPTAGWLVACAITVGLIWVLADLSVGVRLQVAETVLHFMPSGLQPQLISEFVDAPHTSAVNLFVTYLSAHGLVVIVLCVSWVKSLNIFHNAIQDFCQVRTNPGARPRLLAFLLALTSLLLAYIQLRIDTESRGMPDLGLVYLFVFPITSFFTALFAGALVSGVLVSRDSL